LARLVKAILRFWQARKIPCMAGVRRYFLRPDASQNAGVAQLVEHFLAKEDVESSNLFARSTPSL
jgi:hypothetical protein